tara:strand:+ start:266 stop:535 length:270 start_codon:yes stop_codon:yes gene_type:complete
MDQNVFKNVTHLQQNRMLYSDKEWRYAPTRFKTEFVRGCKKDRDYTLPAFYVSRQFREPFQRDDYLLQHDISRIHRATIPRIREIKNVQ